MTRALDKKKVSDKEIVGRRAFGDCFAGGDGKVPKGYFKVDVFYESRPADHLSLDRLGLKNVDAKVVEFLTPVCDEHGKTIEKEFICWASFSVLQIKPQKIVPTPIEPSNPYHSELILDDYRNPLHAELLAFKLSTWAKRVDPKR